jgi:hypothetical protein
MSKRFSGAIIFAGLLLAASPVLSRERDPDAGLYRDARQRAEFQRNHPCPLNQRTRGPCPGFVVDHIYPLCAGGADRPDNMQWQTVDAARIKDRWERQLCRRIR